MRYISPKTDFAFKKIFGSAGSRGILRSFLNGVLYEGQPRIASLEIVDPYSIPRLEGMKDSYLDVRAVLNDGQHVLIEMQVLNIPGLEKRVLYNAAKEYSNQLLKGSDYRLLNPVIALTLTDFIMFPELDGQVISRFVLKEKTTLISYPQGDVELVFVELPKFDKELDELKSLTDEWIYFVQRAAELHEVPATLGEVPEIEAAFEIAEAAHLTPEEDHALELKTRWIADQKMLLAAKLSAEAVIEQQEQMIEQKEQEIEQKVQEIEQKVQEIEQKDQALQKMAQRADTVTEKAVAALVERGLSVEEARRILAGE